MKAILEFNLPEERGEYNLANHGSDLFCSLWDLDQELRDHIKHNPDNLKEPVIDAYEVLRERLYELMGNHNINFDMFE
jgi:hypothetical protein